MANQLNMADLQAILALAGLGWSYRRIARELGVDRETVRRYVVLAARRAASTPAKSPADGSNPAMALTGSIPSADAPAGVLEPLIGNGAGHESAVSNPAIALTGSSDALTGSSNALAGSLDPPHGSPFLAGRASANSNPAIALTGSSDALTGSSDALAGSIEALAGWAADSIAGSRIHLSAAWPFRQVIGQKLQQELSAQRIFQDLTDPDQGHGYSGSYHSVRRLVQKLLARRELPVRRMECAPGAEAQVDFGRGAPVIGPDGRKKTTWIFRIVLSHSRKAYCEAVFRQTTDDFLRCLENAFAHFGGLPRTLVIDNLKAAVSRADWFDPELCPKVRSFAEHYGIAILPCKPYTPRHKGKVENSVKYVKRNALAGRTFGSLGEENRFLAQWEATVADLRIHGTTRQQVIKFFTDAEKPALLPLPPARFELFHEAIRTVHRDGHVQVAGAYYSLPPEYLGQQVWARWDGRMVRLFDRKMKEIAVHAQRQPGKFSTLDAHLHPHKISSIEKGADWLLRQVDRIGPKARAWSQAMLQQRGVAGLRVLMGLLSLSKQHPLKSVERACDVALGHGAFYLKSLRQLIEHQQKGQDVIVQQTFEFTSQHPIIRPVADYEQWLQSALIGQSQQECA